MTGVQTCALPICQLLSVMDRGSAVSAVELPSVTFETVELFPEPHDKASAMFSRLVLNPPFPVASEQLALVFVDVFLRKNGYIWEYGIEVGDWVAKLNSGAASENDLAAWMSATIKKA